MKRKGKFKPNQLRAVPFNGATHLCGTADEPVGVCKTADEVVTCWKAPLWLRIKFLFGCPLWLRIRASQMPPVSQMIVKTIFTTPPPAP